MSPIENSSYSPSLVYDKFFYYITIFTLIVSENKAKQLKRFPNHGLETFNLECLIYKPTHSL